MFKSAIQSVVQVPPPHQPWQKGPQGQHYFYNNTKMLFAFPLSSTKSGAWLSRSCMTHNEVSYRNVHLCTVLVSKFLF